MNRQDFGSPRDAGFRVCRSDGFILKESIGRERFGYSLYGRKSTFVRPDDYAGIAGSLPDLARPIAYT